MSVDGSCQDCGVFVIVLRLTMTLTLLARVFPYLSLLGRGLQQQQQRCWSTLMPTRVFFFAVLLGVVVIFPLFSYVIVFDRQQANYHIISLVRRPPSLLDDSLQQIADPPSNDNLAITRPSSSFKLTCSWAADGRRRGEHQKVIGYSIYGDFSQTAKADRYLQPLMETVKDIASAYPGWVVRIYHNLTREEDETSSWKTLEKATVNSASSSSSSSHVDLCNVTEIVANRKLGKAYLNPTTWRWFPLLDGLVDTFMSRDADSEILPRERDAVAEWLASNQSFHIMRDHPSHCTCMLAGLWGVKLAGDSNNRRRQITKAFERLFSQEKHESTYGYDQRFLTKRIWPLAQTSQMAHDSYCCRKFKGSRPFPTQRSRQFEFVGVVKLRNSKLKRPCPEQCRPINVDPQWIYC